MALCCSEQCAGLEMPWLQVQISAGRALKERQCTPKGQAWYVNVQGSVLGVQKFFNWLLKLTNQK